MIAICPACRKNFDVLWPHLWRYKINRNYFCSWTCYRLKQKKRKKEEKVSEQAKKRPRMTRVEMATAMQIWRDDGDIDSYLKAHGIGNIQKWKANQRARKPAEAPKPKTAGDAMEAMMEASDKFFTKWTYMGREVEKPEQVTTVKLDGPLNIETPEGEYAIRPGKITKPVSYDGFLMDVIRSPETGARYEVKDDTMYLKIGAEEFALEIDEWRKLLIEIPKAAAVLGVEL